jgi:hypothetical protein
MSCQKAGMIFWHDESWLKKLGGAGAEKEDETTPHMPKRATSV